MRYKFLVICQLFLSSLSAQKVISGYVYNTQKEPLIGVTIRAIDGRIGVVSNQFGYFSMNLPSGKHTIVASYLLYSTDSLGINLHQDTVIQFFLRDIELKQVTISARQTNTEKVLMNVQQLSVEQIKKIPSIAGETDIIKALSFLPGVTNGSEGSSGLFVRGGTPDQNLILLDDATVYNPNHLFGFLSVFNADVVKHVELYKGGFPARFGGRIASVLDVHLKEGNTQRRKGEISFGLISSRATIEGPLFGKKGSYILAGRASYLDILLLPLRLQYNSGKRSDYFGYRMNDVNFKANYEINRKQRIFLGYYRGQDRLDVFDKYGTSNSKNTLAWGNQTFTLRHIAAVKSDLFWKNSLTYSNFKYYTLANTKEIYDDLTTVSKFGINSRVSDIALKSEIEYTHYKNHQIRAGLEQHLFSFLPRAVSLQYQDADTSFQSKTVDRVAAQETAIFLEDEWHPIKSLGISAGVRADIFRGKGVLFPYLEPRLGISYKISPSIALKASYGRFQQNIHLLSNRSSSGFQNDIWVPTVSKIPPQRAQQLAIGTAIHLSKPDIEFSIEAYYRKMNHQIDYKEGISVQNNTQDNWQNLIETGGFGKSYGLEFGVMKQTGRFTTFGGYTLSKTTRQFANINGGKEFPFTYDFRHNLSITANYRLSKKWDFSMSHVWHTGQAFSFPVASLDLPPNFDLYGGGSLFLYKQKNNIRLPDYLRTDIGFNCSKENRKGRIVGWNFGIYNVFNRKNPYYAQIDNSGSFNRDTLQYTYKPTLKVKSFLPILPSISYSIKF
jgi:TonB dependent receptor/TonB-dependent Receptor Plug Domain/CarboxypepD_reg-like domain